MKERRMFVQFLIISVVIGIGLNAQLLNKFPNDDRKDYEATNCIDLYNSDHQGVYTAKSSIDELFFYSPNYSWAISLPAFVLKPSPEENNSPLLLSLEQNLPNPFNPITKIGFTVAQRMNVKLKVIDNEGKGVAVLTDKVYDSGKYEIDFDGSNLQSGEYLYILVTRPSSIARKMLLQK